MFHFFQVGAGGDHAVGAGAGGSRLRHLNIVEEIIRHVAQTDFMLVACHDDGRAQQVRQLAEIAWPFMLVEHAQDIRRHRVARIGRFRREDFLDDRVQVGALAQRRQFDHQAIQAVIQVFAEQSLGHAFAQVVIRGANKFHIDGDRFAAAQRRDHAFLQHAQQPRLQAEGHVADFIEEQGAAIGLQDLADGPLLARSRKCPVFIAEQFRLDQGFRDRRAIDGDKRSHGPRRVVVDGLRQQFLAGACLAHDEDGNIASQHLVDLFDHQFQLRIARAQVAQARQAARRVGRMAGWCGNLGRHGVDIAMVGAGSKAVLENAIGQAQLRAPIHAHAAVHAQVQQTG